MDTGPRFRSTAAGSNGALRVAGPGKVPAARRGTAAEAGRESSRSGFGSLERRPARDPAAARLPAHTSRVPPTHPETPRSYARRPQAAASAAAASRSRRWAQKSSSAALARTRRPAPYRNLGARRAQPTQPAHPTGSQRPQPPPGTPSPPNGTNLLKKPLFSRAGDEPELRSWKAIGT